MPQITVYSKDLCVQCGAVLRTLNKAIAKGDLLPSDVTVVMIDGSERDARKVPEGATFVSLGEQEQDQVREALVSEQYQAAPVVVLGDATDALVDFDSARDHFAGFRPDTLKAWIADFAHERQEAVSA